MNTLNDRPQSFICHNGEKAPLPFSEAEYERRIATLRDIMAATDAPVVALTSMHDIAYYSGFSYRRFGRPFGCVATTDTRTFVSANIAVCLPWRRSSAARVIIADRRLHNV